MKTTYLFKDWLYTNLALKEKAPAKTDPLEELKG